MPLKFSTLPIFKISATGNDFLLVDLTSATINKAWKKDFAAKSRAAWVKLWCHRHEGLGADGMVFLETDKAEDFAWDFYNSDGSKAEMCGNAARAVCLYAAGKFKKNKLRFRSRVGIVHAQVRSNNEVEVRLPQITDEQWNQVAEWKGARMNYDFVRAGVPHCVVRVPNLNEKNSLKQFALTIKDLPAYQKDGTNVTFVRLVTKQKIESLTFERGVEDFTLSCGTGAVAAAHSVLRGEEDQPVEVRVPGGRLVVIWRNGFPYLRGPARIVAEIFVCP